METKASLPMPLPRGEECLKALERRAYGCVLSTSGYQELTASKR